MIKKDFTKNDPPPMTYRRQVRESVSKFKPVLKYLVTLPRPNVEEKSLIFVIVFFLLNYFKELIE